MNRIEKAIKYINSHKLKDRFISGKTTIIKDLQKGKPETKTQCSGITANFILVLQKRFKSLFTGEELTTIITKTAPSDKVN